MIIRDNKLLSLLDKHKESQILSHLTPYSAPQGTVLHQAGEISDHIYFPTSGMISLLTVMKSGESIETGAIGFDGCVGHNSALSGRNANCESIVQLEITSHRIAKTHFVAAYNTNPGVRAMVHQANELVIEMAQQTAACHALHTAEARFARWLLIGGDHADGNELHITQEFAAEMMGVRRTTVSAVATSLQDKGIIEYRRGRISIRDRKGLERQACECYQAIKNSGELKPVGSPPGSA
jgi:CRP-like cAMP-binding protein